jgi:hypothetical protein
MGTDRLDEVHSRFPATSRTHLKTYSHAATDIPQSLVSEWCTGAHGKHRNCYKLQCSQLDSHTVSYCLSLLDGTAGTGASTKVLFLSTHKQGRKCTSNVTLRDIRVNTLAVENLYVLPILRVSVASVIQYAKRMRRIILSSVACSTLPYFSTLSHKRHDLKKKLLNLKCVFLFSLQLLSEHFLIPKIIRRDSVITVRSLHVN